MGWEHLQASILVACYLPTFLPLFHGLRVYTRTFTLLSNFLYGFFSVMRNLLPAPL
ncbi:hypothetical protein GQ44DRAFT_711574 [Phaeosphaeriaceae sp. PMI808]|nr:hypothetical protein GQ44DRAFT_711574 [Phaeosphaeriaceae sp. PMI808]